MKSSRRRLSHLAALLLLIALSASAAPVPAAPVTPPRPAAIRTLTLRGPATNLTVDLAATVTLELTITGETVSGTMRTEPPLAGSGPLTGRFADGWCELHGQLVEGFQIQLRGVLNDRDFRGTYLVAVPGAPVQYGRFQLAPPGAAPKPPARPTPPRNP